jgi:methylmalonyl-CoA epimerase
MSSPLVSHVGIVVADLEEAIKRFTLLLGQPPDAIHDVPDMGVKVAMFEGSDKEGGHIELLEATSEGSSIARFLQRKGEGLHHVCVGVDDIEKSLAELKAQGVKLIDEVPRMGAMGRKIAFVHPKDSHGVLIELEERER